MEQNTKNQVSNNKKLQEAFNPIIQAVHGEIEDSLFYNYLISQAPTSEEKVILSAIKEEELRHSKQLEAIYRDFTGVGVPINQDENFQIPNSYEEGIKNALFNELEDVVKYRAIRKLIPDNKYKDIFFDIITDEILHSLMLNHLLTLNSNMNNIYINNNLEERYTTGYHTSNFTLSDWADYIIPLINRAQLEAQKNPNQENLFRKYILEGILLGQGLNPQEAIEQIELWKKTGATKLLRN